MQTVNLPKVSSISWSYKKQLQKRIEQSKQNLKFKYSEELLPKADILIRQYVENSKIKNYINNEKIDVLKHTQLLTPREMKKLLRWRWNPSINGYSKKNIAYVDVGIGQENVLETIIHENLHCMSYNNGREGVKYHNKNRGLNEAITQYITLEIIKTERENYENKDNGYYEVVEIFKDFIEFSSNKELFYRAYFQNDVEILKAHFMKICDRKFFKKLSKNFDKYLENRNTATKDEIIESLYIYLSKHQQYYMHNCNRKGAV